MRSIFLFTLSASLLLGGCSKKPPAPTAATPTNETSAASAAAAAPLDGKVDPFLTKQLRAFVQQKGRLPTDFGELARTTLDSRPRTPAGMTWVIDPTTQEVKAVRQ